ncbi:MAG: hypothetical protein Q4A01_07975 [Coriobacteriales bacterium]|nr:hypothetical protein [Coriobacteriales bacterium]
MAGRRRSVLGILVRMLLVVLVAYGVLLFVSGMHVRGEADKATAAYNKYEQCIGEGDFAGAIAAVKQIASSLDEINRESDQWWWEYAEHLPVLGQDVDCMRGLVDVSNALANDALMPVLTQAEFLTTEGDGGFFSELANKAGGVMEMGVIIGDARAVVAQCRTQVDELPVSHFKEVNDMVAQVREAVVSVDDTFDALESAYADVLGAVDSMLG